MRQTIGFLSENNWIMNEKINYMYEGALQASEKFDVNLIRFGYLNANELLNLESQHKAIIELIKNFKLDGLMFTGWSRAVLGDNLQKLKDSINVPLYSIGNVIEGLPSSFMHGGWYLKRLVNHLIKVHGNKHIAYISPWYPDGRNDVYRSTMKRHGLYNEDLYISEKEIQGINMYERAKKAVSILLDERKVTMDAIISLTMEETYTVQKLLKQRGFRIPEDIAVCSYEDGVLPKYADPSITSIYFPERELGYSGIEKIIQYIETKENPRATHVPGRIEFRESCGCTANHNLLDVQRELIEMGQQNEQLETSYRQLEEIGHLLVTSAFDRSKLFNVMDAGLTKLQIPKAAVFLLPPGNSDYQESVLEYAHSVEGRMETSSTCFHSLSDEWFPSERRYSYVVELLHVADEHYGFVLFEPGNQDIRALISFASHISTSLKSLGLVTDLEKEIHLRKKKEAQLTHLAVVDQLTHLFNRSTFYEKLTELCNSNESFCVLYLDTDGFKKINDNYGHDIGDYLLIEVAERMKHTLAEHVLKIEKFGDVIPNQEAVFRVGGDEFVALLHGSDETLGELAEQLIHELRQPFIINHICVRIGASIGMSKYPEDSYESNALVKKADMAMYKSKIFKNTITFYEQL